MVAECSSAPLARVADWGGLKHYQCRVRCAYPFDAADGGPAAEYRGLFGLSFAWLCETTCGFGWPVAVRSGHLHPGAVPGLPASVTPVTPELEA